MTSCLRKCWGFAVDQLPYESAEGGYFGSETFHTYDLLAGEAGISLPRDRDNRLFNALVRGLPDETWCDYDWLTLDQDVALRMSWERFCDTIKHRRRFFFHTEGTDDRDSYTPATLLREIAVSSERMGLLRELPAGMPLWRARTGKVRSDAAEFGPPPVEHALQSNRMNPPGIPMLYLASTARTAVSEVRANRAKVGLWRVAKPLRILDLRRLPPVPSVWANAERDERLSLSFLHDFATDVMTPVERDERVHVDYLPSQVVTEFIRDFTFEDGSVAGIAYRSTVRASGWNVAVFADPVNLGLVVPERWDDPEQWLEFAGVRSVSLKGTGKPVPSI
jgi:hypothetical protein